MKSSVLFQFPPDIKSIPNGNVIEYTTAKIVLSIIMSLLSIINNAQHVYIRHAYCCYTAHVRMSCVL